MAQHNRGAELMPGNVTVPPHHSVLSAGSLGGCPVLGRDKPQHRDQGGQQPCVRPRPPSAPMQPGSSHIRSASCPSSGRWLGVCGDRCPHPNPWSLGTCRAM